MKAHLIATFLLTTSVAMANPYFATSTGVEFFNDDTSVVLKGGKVLNPSPENATGSLKMQLWATDSPYRGGTIRGTLLASTGKLEGLGPQQFYKNLVRTEKVSRPNVRRSYSINLVLLEYRSQGYAIVDHVTLSNRRTLGPPPPLFNLSGKWSWRTNLEAGTVDMAIEKISHTRRGQTGTLKLSLWATETPYRGGAINGWEVGQVRKGQLDAGHVFNDVRNTAKLNPPPPGWYYVSLVLSESDGDRFSVVAYVTQEKTARFD